MELSHTLGAELLRALDDLPLYEELGMRLMTLLRP